MNKDVARTIPGNVMSLGQYLSDKIHTPGFLVNSDYALPVEYAVNFPCCSSHEAYEMVPGNIQRPGLDV